MGVDLRAIEARRAAAVTGEWLLLPQGLKRDGQTKYAVAISRKGNALRLAFSAARFATAAYLVAAHNSDIPELIAEVRRLRAVNEEHAGNRGPHRRRSTDETTG